MDTKQTYILTHPIQSNYGGILQAMALQHVAHTICPASIADYVSNKKRKEPFLTRWRQMVKSMLMRLMPLNISAYPIGLMNSVGKQARNTHLISGDMLQPLPPAGGNNCYIVGSDQVWRASYARALKSTPFFFLDFASQQERAQSIAYAASFGTDTWDGTPEETAQCAQLLKDFKAVSVREHSGVQLCKDAFGVDAIQMPDPTLLPGRNFYEGLINKERTQKPHDSYIAAYVLDSSTEIKKALQTMAKGTELPVQHLMPDAKAPRRQDRFPITIGRWLRYIRDARFMVTDSFHGCVFAIIFNIPFICLGNKRRGTARFDTLLQTYGLQQRLLHADSERDCFMNVLNSPIDWQHVNAIHEAERQRGLDFLKQNLQ